MDTSSFLYFVSLMVFFCQFPYHTLSTNSDPTLTFTVDFTITNIDPTYIVTQSAQTYLISVLATVASIDTAEVVLVSIGNQNTSSAIYTNPNVRRRLSEESYSSIQQVFETNNNVFRGNIARRLAKSTTVQIIAEFTPTTQYNAQNAVTATQDNTLTGSFPARLLNGLNIQTTEFDQANIIAYSVSGGTSYGGISFSISTVFTLFPSPIPPAPSPSPVPPPPLLSPVQVLIVGCSVGAFAFVSLLIGLLFYWRKRMLSKISIHDEPSAADSPIVVEPPPSKYQFQNRGQTNQNGGGANGTGEPRGRFEFRNRPNTNNAHNPAVTLKEKYDDAVSAALDQETHDIEQQEQHHQGHKQSYNPHHHQPHEKIHRQSKGQ